MPGGPKEAYENVCEIFEAISEHVNGTHCLTWLGPGSAVPTIDTMVQMRLLSTDKKLRKEES